MHALNSRVRNAQKKYRAIQTKPDNDNATTHAFKQTVAGNVGITPPPRPCKLRTTLRPPLHTANNSPRPWKAHDPAVAGATDPVITCRNRHHLPQPPSGRRCAQGRTTITLRPPPLPPARGPGHEDAAAEAASLIKRHNPHCRLAPTRAKWGMAELRPPRPSTQRAALATMPLPSGWPTPSPAAPALYPATARSPGRVGEDERPAPPPPPRPPEAWATIPQRPTPSPAEILHRRPVRAAGARRGRRLRSGSSRAPARGVGLGRRCNATMRSRLPAFRERSAAPHPHTTIPALTPPPRRASPRARPP